MADAFLRRLGHHYILAMMVLTRLFGSVGGLLVIYYVELALDLPAVIRLHFHVAALVVVVFSCTLTVLLALWETRRIRRVLRMLHEGREPTAEQSRRAAKDAIAFTGLHHRREAWVVPLTTLVPVLIFLRLADGASPIILMNITIAVFMGIAMALMSTYFAVNHAMQPVIGRLLDHSPAVSYEELPSSRLSFRFSLCSTLIISTTALMISTLASQRAAHILDQPDRQLAEEAVENLRQHTVYITMAAVVLGVTFSAVLANSVTVRIRRLVEAMESVSHGELSLRVRPSGTDEVDRLGRRFNTMLADLERSNQTIRELNQNLEHKVEERTRELEKTLVELRTTQSQLTDLAHSAGMAEIATGVLHNVGNLLNSVNVSTAVVTDRLRDSKLDDFQRTLDRLEAQGRGLSGGLSEFLSTDGRAEKLLSYLKTLSDRLRTEHDTIDREAQELTAKVDNVKEVIAAQQRHARRVTFREDVDLERILRDVLAMHGPSFARHRIEVAAQTAALPPTQLEKNKLIQILDNLIRNAVESMRDHGGDDRRLTISLGESGPDRARIAITDTGGGIETDKLDQIFNYGYTTKRDGNGFGLHSTALSVNALGGSISASSDGAGRGACFVIELPMLAVASAEADPQLTPTT